MVGSKITKEDKVYAAGFMDADGCFSLNSTKTGHLSFCAVQGTDLETLKWFKSLWGGSVSISRWFDKQREEHGKNFKSQWRWSISSKSSEQFLEDIYPHLKLKKPRARLLRIHRSLMGRHCIRTPFNRNKDHKILESTHKEIFNRMKVLNKTGVVA